MTSLLQEKLQILKESKHLEAFKKSLTAFGNFSVVESSEFAPSLNQAIAVASKIDTPRQNKIACTEKEANIFAWVERIFMESRIGVERLYLSTPFRLFPWIVVDS